MRHQTVWVDSADKTQIKKGTIITRPKGRFRHSLGMLGFSFETGLPSGRVVVVAYKKNPYNSKIDIDEVVVDFGGERTEVIPSWDLFYDKGRIITSLGRDKAGTWLMASSASNILKDISYFSVRNRT